MNEQPNANNETLQKIAEQNKKMRKKLLIVVAIVVGVIALLIAVLLIVDALKKENEEVVLPNNYFYPTHQGDIFEYEEYMEKRPDIIMYCSDPNGDGHITSIDAEKEETFAPEVIFLRDFLFIMMHADIDAYNGCFNEIYYKNHKMQTAFSQQMIYDAEIRYGGEETVTNGTKTVTYYLLYKLYENDGSLRRDVGSDAIVPMRVVLRVTPQGDISISEWGTTRTE